MIKRFLTGLVILFVLIGCARTPSSNLNQKLDRRYVDARNRLKEARKLGADRLAADTFTRARKLLDSTRNAQDKSPEKSQLNQYHHVANLANSAKVFSIKATLRKKQKTISDLQRNVRNLKRLHQRMGQQGGLNPEKIRKRLKEQSKKISELREKLSRTGKNVQTLVSQLKNQQKAISRLKRRISKSETELKGITRENKKIATLARNQVSDAVVRREQGRVGILLSSELMFDPDSADLTSMGLSRLREVAKILKQFPTRPVRVAGHVDKRASVKTPYKDDWTFASRRAVNALKYLVYGRAVEKTRIASLSFGSRQPLEEEMEGSSELTNSRLQIVVLPPRKTVYVNQSPTEKKTRRKLAEQIRGVLKDENVKREHGRLALNLSDQITFDPASAVLKRDAKRILNRLGKLLETRRTYPVRIQGHTDDLPPAPGSPYPSNWELSSARAISVLKYLLRNFQLSDREIGAVGMGQFHPLEPNTSEKNRASNRRVEIHLLPAEISR